MWNLIWYLFAAPLLGRGSTQLDLLSISGAFECLLSVQVFVVLCPVEPETKLPL